MEGALTLQTLHMLDHQTTCGSGGGAANQLLTGPGSGGDANKETGTSTPAPNQGYRGGNKAQPWSYIMVLVVVVLVQQVLTRMTTLPGSFGGNGKELV